MQQLSVCRTVNWSAQPLPKELNLNVYVALALQSVWGVRWSSSSASSDPARDPLKAPIEVSTCCQSIRAVDLLIECPWLIATLTIDWLSRPKLIRNIFQLFEQFAMNSYSRYSLKLINSSISQFKIFFPRSMAFFSLATTVRQCKFVEAFIYLKRSQTEPNFDCIFELPTEA